jgi:hypothetical protein
LWQVLKQQPNRTELVIAATAIGLVATFGAAWFELRGAYAAWRISEWHVFWRGAASYRLGDVVSGGFPVPIEFATPSIERDVARLVMFGGALAIWHSAAYVALLIAGAQRRTRLGVPLPRVGLETGAILILSVLALYVLAMLFSFPSSLSLKVDFRFPGDTHTDTLVWSNLEIFPVAPALALLAGVVQVAVASSCLLTRSTL